MTPLFSSVFCQSLGVLGEDVLAGGVGAEELDARRVVRLELVGVLVVDVEVARGDELDGRRVHLAPAAQSPDGRGVDEEVRAAGGVPAVGAAEPGARARRGAGPAMRCVHPCRRPVPSSASGRGHADEDASARARGLEIARGRRGGHCDVDLEPAAPSSWAEAEPPRRAPGSSRSRATSDGREGEGDARGALDVGHDGHAELVALALAPPLNELAHVEAHERAGAGRRRA